MFEYFIGNDRADINNIMCSITAHDRQQPTFFDDAINDGGRSIPKNATTASLKSLGETLNFIDCWLKQFQHNYQERLEIYHEAMIDLFKQIPTMKSKPLSQDKNQVDIYRYWRCVVHEMFLQ